MLGSGRDLHYSVLMLIAAQYVFTSVMDELDIHPELKADVGIMLYSVSVSRLLLARHEEGVRCTVYPHDGGERRFYSAGPSVENHSQIVGLSERSEA